MSPYGKILPNAAKLGQYDCPQCVVFTNKIIVRMLFHYILLFQLYRILFNVLFSLLTVDTIFALRTGHGTGNWELGTVTYV